MRAIREKNALNVRENPGIMIDPAEGNKAPSILFTGV
jgi:hypothetical protein